MLTRSGSVVTLALLGLWFLLLITHCSRNKNLVELIILPPYLGVYQ